MVQGAGAGRRPRRSRPASFSLIVEDDGPGLAAKDRAEVLQRGARLDETAPGSGLGLSIVDELARAYGGALALSRLDLGGLQRHLVAPARRGLIRARSGLFGEA